MDNSNVNIIDRHDLIERIFKKLDLFNDMYYDNEKAFNNFGEYNYYDIEHICKLIEKRDYVESNRLNDKLISNAKEHLSSIIEMDLSSTQDYGGGYPKYTIFIGEDFSINLHSKSVNIRTLRNISFAKHMVKKYEDELSTFTDVSSDINEWVRKVSKTKGKYVINYAVMVFNKTKITQYHEILLESNEKRKSSYLKELEKYKKRVTDLEIIHEEYMSKLNRLIDYGYSIDIEEDYK